MKTILPNKPIESATIFFSGDRSVGINPAHFTIELFIDLNCWANDEHEKVLNEIKEKIINLYESIMGEDGEVLFDFELEELNKSEIIP